jgi:aminopeptidase N
MGEGAHRASLAVALLALAGPLSACQRKDALPPVSVIQLRVTDLTPALAEAGIDGDVTVQSTKAALKAGGLKLDEHARRSYRATIEVIAFSVTPGGAGSPPAAEVVVDLQLEQSWAAGPEARRIGRGSAPLTGRDRVAAWREALQSAATTAAAALSLDLRARQKPTSALVGDLAGGDPRARERAVRALASRGAIDAARALEKLVRDPDPEVARAAVETLTAFKDPASARVLIEAAQAGDTATTLRLLPVLAEIGGPDVEGYLLTLESGHADRNVRRAAGEALARARGERPPTRGATR